MPRSIGVAVGVGALFLAGWNCLACSSSNKHPGSALGSAGTGTSNGTAAGTGGSDGLVVGQGDGGSGNGSGNNPACAAKVATAQAVPLDMVIMLDTSSSMLDPTATQVSKWDAVKLALESFLNDKASAGIGVGLQYFPQLKPNTPATCTNDAQCGQGAPCFLKLCFDSIPDGLYPCSSVADCPQATQSGLRRCLPIAQCSNAPEYFCPMTGSECTTNTPGENLGTCVGLTESFCLNATICDVAKYAAPATPIAVLPGAAAGLVASIDAKAPLGDTPTGPALSGAIQQASAWATAHKDHRVVAVLATDGVPTQCTPDTIPEIAALARAGVQGNPSISTFAIGVFSQNDIDQGAQSALDTIARQGGTNKAFIVDTQKDVTAQFQAALDSIRGARLACQYQVPEPTNGGSLNYGKVNVTLTNGGQKTFIYYVKDAAACDASGGWYYDVEPSSGTPTKIIACPATCTQFESASNGATVGIELDCDTIIK
ncbi:MAG TPA: hypothetical protein VFK05_09630 [Polyangiaceae bacterium]|nr:hypothetical protein [Polyangiaceae bacterium]